MRKEIIISGYGHVAREFIKLVVEKQGLLKKKYNLEIVITGIIGSKGMLFQKEGIALETLLEHEYGSKALLQYADLYHVPLQKPIFSGDVLIDCTPTNMESGEPGLSYVMAALDAGMDFVAVSKGALVHSFKALKERAIQKGSRFKYSGATAAALPTLDIGEYSLAGSTITSIEGILNGTSNYILSRMYEENVSFATALKQAQEKGIAEANPALDIQGIDSGCKILLLANSLLEADLHLQDVSISGIDRVTTEDMRVAKQSGKQVKLGKVTYNEDTY